MAWFRRKTQLDRIEARLIELGNVLTHRTHSIMIDVSKLLAVSQTSVTATDSCIQMMTALGAQVTTLQGTAAALSAQLATATASNDPTQLAAVQTAIDNIVTALGAEAANATAAVAKAQSLLPAAPTPTAPAAAPAAPPVAPATPTA
jgi:hypothetical protein